MHAVSGETQIKLLFRGSRAPYYGRGATKEIEVKFSGWDGEFSLYGIHPDNTKEWQKLATTTDQKFVAARDLSEEVRQWSFSRTKLPYAEHGIGPDEFVNLSAYSCLQWRLADEDEINEEDVFAITNQRWSQLVLDEHTPAVRFPFNLVAEQEYVFSGKQTTVSAQVSAESAQVSAESAQVSAESAQVSAESGEANAISGATESASQ